MDNFIVNLKNKAINPFLIGFKTIIYQDKETRNELVLGGMNLALIC